MDSDQRDDGSLDETRDVRASRADATSAHDPTVTQEVTSYRTEIGHYRRPLFVAPWLYGWLAGLIGLPLILSLLFGGKPAATTATPAATSPAAAASASVNPAASASVTPGASASGTASTASASASASPRPNVFAISQDGRTVTVSGTVPDEATKTAVVSAVKQAYGTTATVADKLVVQAGAPAIDAANFGPLATALKGVTGLTFDVASNTATLSGAVADEAAKTAALDAVAKAFPGATVQSAGLIVGNPNVAPTSCGATNDYVKVVTAATKIQFGTGGSALTADSQAALGKIAAAVKKCPSVKLLVSGNTDNTGTEATNQALSLRRAEAVKSSLVALGVPAASITTAGNGSSKPIASNDTLDGRAKNRRVDVTVQ